jgi:hypothetical protein
LRRCFRRNVQPCAERKPSRFSARATRRGICGGDRRGCRACDRRVVVAGDPQGRRKVRVRCHRHGLAWQARRGTFCVSLLPSRSASNVIQHRSRTWKSGYCRRHGFRAPSTACQAVLRPGTVLVVKVRSACTLGLRNKAPPHWLGSFSDPLLRLSSRLSRLALRAPTRGCRNGLRFDHVESGPANPKWRLDVHNPAWEVGNRPFRGRRRRLDA